MKKRIGLLVLSLSFLPAGVYSFNYHNSISEELRYEFARQATTEAFHALIGKHSFAISGVTLLSTDEAAHITGDLALGIAKKINLKTFQVQ